MNFQELPWDSNFFGYPIAKCEIDESIIDFEVFRKESSKFKLVYCFCNDKIDIFPSGEFHLVDIKVTLKKQVQALVKEPLYLVKHFEIGGDLQQLAFLSGKFSRFKLDKNFSSGQFERLYSAWLETNCKNSEGKFLFSHVVRNKILGFVAFSIFADLATVDLIAVDQSSQRKGLGVGFLRDIDLLVSEAGIQTIQVSTQFENKPALTLYEKSGYKVSDTKFIYHFWNEHYLI